ncbi:glycosyltransferase family 2 protein [Spirosoma fluviale]|uniref:Glycosyl transferase family 2 n=1 Tax=Spirosoma fluviale TaxID=1597977 RepID=A0A286FBT8_9BACT|nr:glycosyltransferase [Spirosoma fluviale]SOD80701.1 Glycosyl transferase family 2 [Spirosoma fluviale]
MSPFLNQIKPWVSVICTCYNHHSFVNQALQSVVDQDYPNVELIVIDNGSFDRSAERIAEFTQQYPAIQFIQNPVNLGLNRAFNQGLALAEGRYVIDLSADDVLLPGRLSKQVAQFENLAGPYAVVFSNATYIDRSGHELALHYAVDAQGHACSPVPTGNVFRPILESYFICTPTMMMRRDVLNELGGYDETLAYEDFDFWVRSARLYHYAYLDEVLTQKRLLPSSFSAQIISTDTSLLRSTLAVCHKAFERCVTPDEFQALASRIRRFIRKAFYVEQFDLALQFGDLLQHIEQPDWQSNLILALSKLHLPVNKLYRHYLKWSPVLHSAKLD